MEEIKVVDNFFDDPDFIRKEALKVNYYEAGKSPGGGSNATFPGKRSLKVNRLFPDVYKNILQGMKIKFDMPGWFWHNCYFQYCIESDGNSWIHKDDTGDIKYVLIVYLAPSPSDNSGTIFYKDIDGEIVNKVENVYNRGFIYLANQYHKSDTYFGDTLKNSRLFLISFFKEG